MDNDDPRDRLLGGAADEPPTASAASPRWYRRRRVQLVLALVGCVVIALVTLVHLVLALRGTTMAFRSLHLPDLCSDKSLGAIGVEFVNPSLCAPTVGPFDVHLSANGTSLLVVSLPAFSLAHGVSSVQSHIFFSVQASPADLQRFLFQSPTPALTVSGSIPIHISCLLVPFTVHVDVHDLLSSSASVHRSGMWAFPRRRRRRPASNEFDIAKHIDEMVHAILHTIGLSRGHIDEDDHGIYVFSDVTFEYASQVQWTVPDLSFELTHPRTNETLLRVGFYGFTLGGGTTHIATYTYLGHADTAPLEAVLQSYLGGSNVSLAIVGGHPQSHCLAQQLFNRMSFPIEIPGTIDGQPAFLRKYELNPTLKKLDSETHTCELRLDVDLQIHNPLPIELDLVHLQFDILYHNTSSPKLPLKDLATAIDNTAVAWPAHGVNNVSFPILVTSFEVCEDLIVLYLSDQLAFSLHHGNLSIALGGGSAFDIPFTVDDIRVHPPSDVVESTDIGATYV
ncbi:hypothetical protein SPRG_13250 [Saprolegnia parasitica CBS 223.65]|uniref:Uncharacterized protein n=1 Tax=Saprolegnia parasitica (strain CBS 223.65) TaxID=695850 RepID=A0A067BPX3_SAPPC|nr:hypothetical protein SPRG_13250 [Saprolegnia parasitica CBS 223.65]KDO20554.1 hypothetical protein SPRG_13250 [Saprolegnia parasitica CBS 223.65]|eukprot:XP_012208743.1 hypothetical protein SPRG_13250 [Saprolegnia parasitica CBS 223.65]